MIGNWINKLRYKRYCNGKEVIKKIIYPDHLADILDKGQIRRFTFKSGNEYKMRFIKREMDRFRLDIGYYEISHDIQPLTFEQFISLI